MEEVWRVWLRHHKSVARANKRFPLLQPLSEHMDTGVIQAKQETCCRVVRTDVAY